MSSGKKILAKSIDRIVTVLRKFSLTAGYVDLILKDKDINELTKGSGLAFLFKILGFPLRILISLSISRWYGAESMGLYGIVLTLIPLLVSIGLLGIGSAMPRFIGENIATQHTSEEDIYRTSFWLILGMGMGISLLLFFFAGGISRYIFAEVHLILPLQVTALFLVPLIILKFNLSFLLAKKELYQAELIDKIILPLSILFIVSISYFLWPSIYIPIWGYLGAGFIAMLVSIVSIRKERMVSLTGKMLSIKKLLKISRPMLITGMAFFVVTHTDILMLGVLTDTASVGIYKVVVQLSMLVAFFLPVISTFMIPQVSEKIWGGQLDSTQKLLQIANIGSSFPAIGIASALLLFGGFFLGIFGEEFILGRSALIVLTVFQLVNVVTGYGGIILNYGGFEKLYKNILVSCALLNIVLNYLLIPSYGMLGAAVSTLISFNLANFIVIYFCIKKTGIYPYFTL